jgi:hypothetical protein
MNRKLDIGNLSPTTDQRESRELFSQAGQYPFRGQALTVSERRPDAPADHDRHFSPRPAAAPRLNEREGGHHSNPGCREMLDEGGPLRAGD